MPRSVVESYAITWIYFCSSPQLQPRTAICSDGIVFQAFFVAKAYCRL